MPRFGLHAGLKNKTLFNTAGRHGRRMARIHSEAGVPPAGTVLPPKGGGSGDQ